ncbi:hypothetical protein LSAT2_022575 [Lamellibrachia satsuma]|nr:hypothetical protein LSAT2_022575 [Lamellibrachia satsuma]
MKPTDRCAFAKLDNCEGKCLVTNRHLSLKTCPGPAMKLSSDCVAQPQPRTVSPQPRPRPRRFCFQTGDYLRVTLVTFLAGSWHCSIHFWALRHSRPGTHYVLCGLSAELPDVPVQVPLPFAVQTSWQLRHWSVLGDHITVSCHQIDGHFLIFGSALHIADAWCVTMKAKVVVLLDARQWLEVAVKMWLPVIHCLSLSSFPTN